MAKFSLSLEYLKVTEAMAKCNLSLNYSQKIFWLDWTNDHQFFVLMVKKGCFKSLQYYTTKFTVKNYALYACMMYKCGHGLKLVQSR